LLAVALISATPFAISFILPRDEASLRRLVRWLVAFATGALLGTAFLHLIPEGLSSPVTQSTGGILVLAGFFGFFVLEHHLWRHQHEESASKPALHPVAMLNLLGDAAHNLVDGMAVAAAFLIEPAAGISTSIAVLLHEVPQEMGDYGVLLHSGLSRGRAIAWNLASAAVALIGAGVVLAFGTRFAAFSAALVPFAAGGFIYIAASDLIPRLREEPHLTQTGMLLFTIMLGILLTALPLLFEHG
jgi:zinc and cadmium transporter